MKASGWVVGGNIEIEYRFAAGDLNRLRAFWQELVDINCDVIVSNTNFPGIAVLRQFPVPIVFAMVSNPVALGLMKSQSHPDENMTGFTSFDFPSIIGKWLELLKVIAPRVVRVAIVFNPDAYLLPSAGSFWLRPLEAIAPSFAAEPVAVPVHDVAEMQQAFAALARGPESGLLVATDAFTVGNYSNIVSLASQHFLPGCYPYRYFATEGGLMSYGPNGARVFRQAASYVDRILRGAKPVELPIQRPTTLELVINARTAKALGLMIPRNLAILADEVIE
jgi:putative ABC transport system substrate-binding protein